MIRTSVRSARGGGGIGDWRSKRHRSRVPRAVRREERPGGGEQCIRELEHRGDLPEAHAIVIVCTNFASDWKMDELECDPGKPVLDPGVVTVCEVLQLAAIQKSLVGWAAFWHATTERSEGMHD